ncbi:eCIS core domain-containing protein [Kaistia hirudinis]|uniref:eCIS core domain-containing protein n=1 Tax=Kaistia hirudinis TaxID=1293440 RepID=UPI0035ED7D35
MNHAPLRSKVRSPELAQGARAAPRPASQLADETAPPTPKFGGSLAGLPAMPPTGGSGGLEPGLRGDMERSFGADFCAVRLHSDAAAARTAGQYAAKAVTVGDNVYFGGGRYAPQSGEGRRLIAHELAHVVQQRRGGAAAPRSDGMGDLERDAGRAADGAMGGGRAMVRLGSATGLAAEPEEPWYKRAIDKAKDVGSSVKDKATSFVQEVAKNPNVLIDHAEKLQPAVLLAEATQKLADKAEGKPVLGGLTRNIANIAKANANLVTKPAKAFGEKLVSKDKDGWQVHPLDATKAWKAGVDSGFKGVHDATFKAVDDFEDVEPAKPMVDEKAHPTLATLERGSLAVSNNTSKYSRQFVGGVAKAAFGMVEGIGKMAVHPFDTVKGLGQLPGPSLVNPLKFIGTFVQLEEDLYDATFPDLEKEARKQVSEGGQPSGKPAERMSHGQALRKFGGALLPDQERDRRQTAGLAKALGENYIEAWKAKRYAELPGLAVVDIGSFFVGGGAAGAAGKGGKVAEVASATTKIGELAKTGEVAGSLAKAEELASAGGKVADVAKGTEAAKTAEAAKAGDVADATKVADAHPPSAEAPKPAVEAPKPAAETPKPVEPAPEAVKAEPPSKLEVDPLEHAEGRLCWPILSDGQARRSGCEPSGGAPASAEAPRNHPRQSPRPPRGARRAPP